MWPLIVASHAEMSLHRLRLEHLDLAMLHPFDATRCATLEKSDAGKLHVHLALHFRQPVDRTVQFFAWKGRIPNASSKITLDKA